LGAGVAAGTGTGIGTTTTGTGLLDTGFDRTGRSSVIV
jgi:hypothetical protein